MDTQTRNKIVVVVVLLILAVSYWYFFKPSLPLQAPAPESAVTQNGNVISAMFTCTDGKAIGAEFSDRSVSLSLSDGRNLTLPQTISGSGARYANADESFVFWNKGNTAFIEENSTTTYTGCITATAE